MPLILTLTGGDAGAGRESRTLGQGNLAIGRSPDNGWVLPDPDRLVSKTHCFVSSVDGRYVLTDVSTNGTFVNGSPERVPRNGQVVLTDGDEIRLGGYVLAVTETAAALATPPPPAESAEFGTRPDPLDPLGPDPLEGPFASAAAGFAHPLPAPPPPAWRTDDPFDAADAATPGRFEDDFLRGRAQPEPWQGPSQKDNADAPLQAFSAPKAVPPPSLDDLDIDALLGDLPPGAAPPPAAPQPVAPQPVAPQPAAFQPAAPPPPLPAAPPPAARQPAAPPPPTFSLDSYDEPEPPAAAAPPPPPPASAPVSAPAPAAAAPAAAEPSAARLLAAFLEGAGVPGLATGADPEASLRAAGEVFRVMVEGVRQVLISRAAIKNELRVEQTMLRARDNNALKFSITPDDAVAALLQPGRAGYKPPPDAAREAFADISSHEMAVMAGVQTALMALLKRFEPATLEQRLVNAGLLGSVMPAARKARTWELFCATYGEIVREAEDDFQSVFGREFARAYDAQVRKL